VGSLPFFVPFSCGFSTLGFISNADNGSLIPLYRLVGDRGEPVFDILSVFPCHKHCKYD